MKFQPLLLSCALMTLTACAQTGTLSRNAQASAINPCTVNGADQELLISLSQEMVTEGRLHAALANLEQLPPTIPQVQLHMADILRDLAPDRAKGMYRTLLNGECYAADAHHGLGQLEAARGFYREASGHLRVAAQLAPTDLDIRNDLGVVYMQMRRLPEARFELMTALELGENNLRAAGNLLTLLLYEDQWTQASDLLNRLNLPPAEFETAQQRAQQLLQEDARMPAVATE